MKQPVENVAFGLRLGELRFQRFVLLPFLEMPVKRDDEDAPAGEKRHVADDGQIVGVDVQLKLWLEIEAVFIKEPGVYGVVTCHAFDLRGVEHQPTARFRDIGKADARKPRDVLAGILAVDVLLLRNGFRPDGPAIITHDTQNAFHQCTFAVARGFAVEEEHTLVPGVTADRIAKSLLEEPRSVCVAAHDLVNVAVETLTDGLRIILDMGDFGKPVLRVMVTERHRPQVERAVFAVKQIAVGVEFLHGNRVNALGFFEVDVPEPTLLPFAVVLQIVGADGFIFERQQVQEQAVRKVLAQLHDHQAADVGDPARAVVDIPFLALRHIPGDAPIHVRKEPAEADVSVPVPVVLRGIQFDKRLCRFVEVVRCAIHGNRLVELGRHRHGISQCGGAVILPLPFLAVKP